MAAPAERAIENGRAGERRERGEHRLEHHRQVHPGGRCPARLGLLDFLGLRPELLVLLLETARMGAAVARAAAMGFGRFVFLVGHARGV